VTRRWAASIVGAIGVAGALSSCGNPYAGATLGQQVQSWMRSTSFASGLRTLQADGRRIPEVEVEHDPAAVRTACDVLVTDALSANQNLPSPDAMLNTILAAAYGHAAAAGRQCLDSAGGGAGLLRAAADLAAADRGYVAAEARLDDIDAPVSAGS